MARPKSSEPCIFCGFHPCQCMKRTSIKPAKKPRKLTIETIEAPLLEPIKPAPSMLDAMRKAAADAPQRDLSHLKDPPKRKAKASSPQGYQQPVEKMPVIKTDINALLFADAVRNLAPILHPDEIEKYKVLITSQPSAADRARIWRARRYC